LRRIALRNCFPDKKLVVRCESMSDVISEYQKWKQQGDDLRLKAKQTMEARYRELGNP